jgi:hypothetical protein
MEGRIIIMKKNEFRKTILDVVSKQTYGSDIIQTRKAVECIPKIIEAIDVDKESFKNKIEVLINRSGNTLTSFLRIFGLKMINGRKLEWECENDIALFSDMIKLDVDLFSQQLENMIKVLSEFEKTNTRQTDEGQKAIKEQFKENERLKNELARVKSQSRIKENETLKSIQEIMAIEYNSNGENSEVYKQMCEMLKDMGIRVCWASNEDHSESEFQALNITKKRQNMFGKPCFKRGEEVVLQGLRYNLISAEKAEETENRKYEIE